MILHSMHDEKPSQRNSTVESIAHPPRLSISEKTTSDVESCPSDRNGSPPETPDNKPINFPEGGLWGWLAVIGGMMVTFCTFGVLQSFGVYQDYYTRNLLSEHSPSQISLIGSIQGFLIFAVGLPAGRLFDAGYFHHTMLTGSVIYLFSIFMLSLARPHQYYQVVLSQGVGMGLGMGLMFLPSLNLTSHYFRAKRSTAMGIVIAGSSFGGVIYPILLNNIFGRAPGFKWGVRTVAFIDLAFLLIANLIMRTRLPPKNTSGEASGLAKELLRDGPFLLYLLGAFLGFLSAFVPFFYLQLFASTHGVSPRFTKYSITVMNAASIFGRTVPNILADNYGPVNVMTIASFVSAGLIFALFGATSVAGVTVFAIFYGFTSGGVVALAAPAVGSFITHADMSDLGLRIGTLSFTLAFALLTGNPIAGALLTDQRIWHRPVIFAAVVLFSSSLCYALLWRSLSKRRNSRRI